MYWSTWATLLSVAIIVESITLEKWTQLAGYSVLVVEPPQGEEAPQDEHSTDSIPHAPIPPMPEATSTVPPPTPPVPLATSSTSEPFMTISATEFRAMRAPQHLENPDQPQEPVQIPADTPPPALAVASTEHIPEVAPSAPQATPQTPPVIPPISEPSPSAEPRIAISIIEYRGLCNTFQALATSHSILTQQITALSAHQE
ncbi:lysine-rich arabinogalactan protein 19-like [Vitis riparia]|uniref:lysine-rich arabinogalactan protein 19-like n=1 Tax=Vitis riparia TaxID=96939 RepID=UPI00155A86EE|nr:lysine-rich arabinogalactan protein 19-like [Vitis riparia]